ncbi:hypothetical protein EOA75_30995, partial [Mesorhizobium sp. M1A.F.Ca.IN.022.07.1.1]
GSVLTTLGTSRALPFLTGNQQLSGGFDAIGGNCGLTAAIQQEHTARPERRNSPAPPSPGTPDPPSPPRGDKDDGNNGHGNDPGKHDPSNPGKSKGPGKK